MMHLLQNLRYALRTLVKTPGLTAVIVVSLAIGIGANTAIFSVVNALMLRPLPYPDPDRLAILWLRSPGINIPQDWPSPGEYVDIQTQNRSFGEMAIAIGVSGTLTGRDKPEQIEGLQTSSSLFHLLGARPMMGRLLQPEDDQPGKPSVAILSHALWKRMFSSDPNIVGKAITLLGMRDGPEKRNNQYTVAGVLPPDFLLNPEVLPTVASIERMEVFLPLPLGADAVNRRGDENYNVLARLKSGITMAEAQADVRRIADGIRVKDKRDRTFTISVVPLLDQVVGDVRRAVLVLLGSVALVLLIACANVANLLLSRAGGRQKEVAIRAALGAGWGHLVGQLLTESVVLGLMGGASGLLIAWWGLYVIHAVNPGNIPRLDEIRIDDGVLAFTFGISVLTGIVFGIAPALRALKVDLNTTLRAGGRTTQSEGGLGASRKNLRSLLVVAEISLSLMLLIGAGLLIRSFVRLQGVSPGFNPDRLISMRLGVGAQNFEKREQAAQFFHEIEKRVAALPGVTAAGGVSALPLTSSVGWGGIDVEGFHPQPGQELQADQRTASADYFHTMEIPLIKGRFFSEQDCLKSEPVALVDEKFAKRFWPQGDAIGKHIGFGPKNQFAIVGVVGAVKEYGLDVDGRIVAYLPERRALWLVARTASDPSLAAGAIVREIQAMDKTMPVYDIRTMADRMHGSLARQRFSAIMLGAFGIFALVLAVVGVYGVMSYLVTQGTHDIGVRIAIGAKESDILGLVLRQGMSLALIGIAVGLGGAAALTRVMASLLFGVSATDVVTFTAVALIFAITAFLAILVPARRATGVDAMIALRDE